MNSITTPNHAGMKSIFPALSILSTESAEQFEQIFDELLDCLKGQDVVEGILIREYAEASWEIHRYTRLRTLSFERNFKQTLDYQVQRLKVQRTRRQERAANFAEHATRKPDDIARVVRLEDNVVSVDTEADEILKRTPSELDHAHALEKNLLFHKDAEALIASMSKRRNETLQMLDMYRAGLGKRVDEAMSEILDAEHEVVEEPVHLLDSPTSVPGLGEPARTDSAKESE